MCVRAVSACTRACARERGQEAQWEGPVWTTLSADVPMSCFGGGAGEGQVTAWEPGSPWRASGYQAHFVSAVSGTHPQRGTRRGSDGPGSLRPPFLAKAEIAKLRSPDSAGSGAQASCQLLSGLRRPRGCTGGLSSTLSFNSCVTLGVSPNLSEPQFIHLTCGVFGEKGRGPHENSGARTMEDSINLPPPCLGGSKALSLP